MMTKTAYYMQMAQEAAAQITGSKEQWTAFLTTSARLYKYPFAEQLMIYKQRPEATACAEYDLWNDRMNRYVKRGSKGIALLDMRGEQPKLRYVFDVADTGERKNSRPVQLWKMNAEHEQPIIRALDAAFDVSAGAGSLENHIMEAAERLARDYWEENRRQIGDIVADSYLEGYDESDFLLDVTDNGIGGFDPAVELAFLGAYAFLLHCPDGCALVDGGKKLHALTLIASVVDTNVKPLFRKLGIAQLRPCFTPMFQRFGTAPVGSGNGVEHKLSVCVPDTVAVLVQLIHPALL